MSDGGSARELHIESALAVANTEPVRQQTAAQLATRQRTVLVANSHFVFEKLQLPPSETWRFEPTRETWLLATNGTATIDGMSVQRGDVVFAQDDDALIECGAQGLEALVAYVGPDFDARLFRPPDQRHPVRKQTIIAATRQTETHAGRANK